jgi:hypothetical protein
VIEPSCGQRGYARIADFGMCADVRERWATGKCGTKGHLAPEQYCAKKRAQDGGELL